MQNRIEKKLLKVGQNVSLFQVDYHRHFNALYRVVLIDILIFLCNFCSLSINTQESILNICTTYHVISYSYHLLI